MINSRSLHAILLFSLLGISLSLSACGQQEVQPGVKLTYQPPFAPIIFTIGTDGISVAAKGSIVTEWGTFSVAADVADTLKPIDNIFYVIIRYNRNGVVKDEEYRIQTHEQTFTVKTVGGETTVTISKDRIFVDASKSNIKLIELKDATNTGDTTSTTLPTVVPTPHPTPTPSIAPALYHTQGFVNGLAWSHNGEYLAIASGLQSQGDVEIWDVKTQQKMLTYTGNINASFTSVSWSPDDTELVSCNNNEIITVWKRSGQTLFSVNHDVKSVAWSPNGQYIAYAGNDTGIIDAASGNVIEQLPVFSGFSNVTDIAWSPDSSRLAGINVGSSLDVWSVSGNGASLYEQSGTSINALAWSHDGTKIAIGEDDGNLKIIDANSGQVLVTNKTVSDAITALAWSHNGKIATGGFYQATIQISDAQGNQLQTFPVNSDPNIDSLAWSPDTHYVAVGTERGVTQIFPVS